MGKKDKKLADRTGTYTPSIEDRRRIAVSNCIMIAFDNDGQVFPVDVQKAIQRNVVNDKEVPQMVVSVTKRLFRIAQGGGF